MPPGVRGGALLAEIRFRPYREVLSDRRAVAFNLAGFVARSPLAMTGIGIVLLVSLTTGSFGLAGKLCLTAAGTVTGAAHFAPLWGRAIYRVGQARAARRRRDQCPQRGSPGDNDRAGLAAGLVAAIGAGVGFSTAGSAVRARWTLRLTCSATAFALEAMLTEAALRSSVRSWSPFWPPRSIRALGISVSAMIGFCCCARCPAQHRAAVRIIRPPVALSWSPSPSRVWLWAWGMEVNVVAFAGAGVVRRIAGVTLDVMGLRVVGRGRDTGDRDVVSRAAKRFRWAPLFSRSRRRPCRSALHDPVALALLRTSAELPLRQPVLHRRRVTLI